MNLNPLLPKFSVILMNSVTSQRKAEEKFSGFMKLRRVWDLILHVSLQFFNFKFLRRKDTSLYTASICVEYKPSSQSN